MVSIEMSLLGGDKPSIVTIVRKNHTDSLLNEQIWLFISLMAT